MIYADTWTTSRFLKPGDKLYRYELAFDGEPMGVGFLHGLDDINLPLETESKVLSPFENLPCPNIETQCEFWFTAFGEQAFKEALVEFQNQILDYGWSLLQFTMTLDEQDVETALYADPFQACWDVLYLETDHTKGEMYTPT